MFKWVYSMNWTDHTFPLMFRLLFLQENTFYYLTISLWNRVCSNGRYDLQINLRFFVSRGKKYYIDIKSENETKYYSYNSTLLCNLQSILDCTKVKKGFWFHISMWKKMKMWMRKNTHFKNFSTESTQTNNLCAKNII